MDVSTIRNAVQSVEDAFSDIADSGVRGRSAQILEHSVRAATFGEDDFSQYREYNRMTLAQINRQAHIYRRIGDTYTFVTKGVLPRIDRAINFLAAESNVTNTFEFLKSFGKGVRLHYFLEILQVTMEFFVDQEHKYAMIRRGMVSAYSNSAEATEKNIKASVDAYNKFSKLMTEYNLSTTDLIPLLESYSEGGGNVYRDIMTALSDNNIHREYHLLPRTVGMLSIVTGMAASELFGRAGDLRRRFGATAVQQSQALYYFYAMANKLGIPMQTFYDEVMDTQDAFASSINTMKKNAALLGFLKRDSLSAKRAVEYRKSIQQGSPEQQAVTVMTAMDQRNEFGREFLSSVQKYIQDLKDQDAEALANRKKEIENKNTQNKLKPGDKGYVDPNVSSILQATFSKGLKDLEEFRKSGQAIPDSEVAAFVAKFMSDDLTLAAQLQATNTWFTKEGMILSAESLSLSPELFLNLRNKSPLSVLKKIEELYVQGKELADDPEYYKMLDKNSREAADSMQDLTQRITNLYEQTSIALFRPYIDGLTSYFNAVTSKLFGTPTSFPEVSFVKPSDPGYVEGPGKPPRKPPSMKDKMENVNKLAGVKGNPLLSKTLKKPPSRKNDNSSEEVKNPLFRHMPERSVKEAPLPKNTKAKGTSDLAQKVNSASNSVKDAARTKRAGKPNTTLIVNIKPKRVDGEKIKNQKKEKTQDGTGE